MTVTLNLALAGLGIGAVAALAGLGLLVTYRATGVFNVAFGAIAVFAAYVNWSLAAKHHWPVGFAALFTIGFLCPALGFLLDRFVFRSLRLRDAGPAESIVASLGVFVLLVGGVTILWGRQTRLDAPSLVPRHTLHLGGDVVVRLDVVVDVAIVLVLLLALLVLERTRVGMLARAVVENRALAELAGVRADRVSSLAWALGATLAGLAGILIAPLVRLDPFGLTLAVLETMAVVVIARLTRPLWVVGSALVLGIAQSEVTRLHLPGAAGAIVSALGTNLFVVALIAVLLVVRRLEDAQRPDSGTTVGLATRGDLPTPRYWWLPATAVLAVPLLLSREGLVTAQRVPALAIIFVSIVLVTGYAGQLSLGQAGFAGLGALITAKFSNGSMPFAGHLPSLLALVLAVLSASLLGFLVGWPAIRRRGLFLALATFSIAAVASKFVFDQPYFTNGITVPTLSGFRSAHMFYVLELVCLGVSLLVVQNHHRGRLGRSLQAVRDDERGALACGVNVRRLRVWTFAVSSGLAALGGALLSVSDRSFDPTAFDPIIGLIWFAAVVVFGIDSATSALLGAALIVLLDSVHSDVSSIVIGTAAVAVGFLPGGLLYTVRRLARNLSHRVAGAPLAAAGSPPIVDSALQLSSVGREVARRLR
jgi:branched-chain amino acid transport system permease protein